MPDRLFPIHQFGDPVLRRKARRISTRRIRSSDLQRLTRGMFLALRKARGVGLAAPQVGYPSSIVVVNIGPGRTPYHGVFFNLVIVARSKSKVVSWEGCLSLPAVRGKVRRSNYIRVRYQDESGVKREERFSGYLALVLQHEVDHLNGILYVDRMRDLRSLMSAEEYRTRIS